MDAARDIIFLIGRVLISGIFIYDGVYLFRFPAETVTYMERFGVHGSFLYPAALVMFLGGILVVAGFRARFAALLLAAFCVSTALIFHRNLQSANELIHFGKDLGLAGGFLFLAASGAGRYSIDHWRRRRSAEN